MDSVVLWVCVDCWHGVHGILEDTDALARYRDAMERVQHDNEPVGVSIHPDGACEQWEDDGHVGDCECNTVVFSWSPCELCLSPLGGSRHAVTLFVEF